MLGEDLATDVIHPAIRHRAQRRGVIEAAALVLSKIAKAIADAPRAQPHAAQPVEPVKRRAADAEEPVRIFDGQISSGSRSRTALLAATIIPSLSGDRRDSRASASSAPGRPCGRHAP